MFEFLKNLFSKWFPKEEDKKWYNDYIPGLQPSLPDYRDLNVKELLGSIDLAPLPEEYRIPYLLKIKDSRTSRNSFKTYRWDTRR